MKTLLHAAGLALVSGAVIAAPSIDARLAQQIASAPLGKTSVVITFERQPGAAELAALRQLGIGGIVLQDLPMVLTALDKAQFDALGARTDVHSLW
jgi:hypothetical protein